MSDIQELKDKIKDLRVLFADDEEQIRKGTGSFLNKFFDDVVICKDGEEGLSAFKKDPTFNIIIADIKMPKMDGITMVRKIKEIKPDIYIIFITASRDEQECEDSLYDLYIDKPISYENVKLIMKNVSELG